MIFSLEQWFDRGQWKAFSLGWYGSAFLNEDIQNAAKNTLKISVTATIASTIAATPRQSARRA